MEVLGNIIYAYEEDIPGIYDSAEELYNFSVHPYEWNYEDIKRILIYLVQYSDKVSFVGGKKIYNNWSQG